MLYEWRDALDLDLHLDLHLGLDLDMLRLVAGDCQVDHQVWSLRPHRPRGSIPFLKAPRTRGST